MKKIVDCLYIHRSNLKELEKNLTPEQFQIVYNGICAMDVSCIKFDIIKFNKKTNLVSFIIAYHWNSYYEPIVGESFIYSNHGFVKCIQGGKTVYHQKHLFVPDFYNGFDIQDSIERTRILESIPEYKENKSRIGGAKWWIDFLIRNNLPVFMK